MLNVRERLHRSISSGVIALVLGAVAPAPAEAANGTRCLGPIIQAGPWSLDSLTYNQPIASREVMVGYNNTGITYGAHRWHAAGTQIGGNASFFIPDGGYAAVFVELFYYDAATNTSPRFAVFNLPAYGAVATYWCKWTITTN